MKTGKFREPAGVPFAWIYLIYKTILNATSRQARLARLSDARLFLSETFPPSLEGGWILVLPLRTPRMRHSNLGCQMPNC